MKSTGESMLSDPTIRSSSILYRDDNSNQDTIGKDEGFNGTGKYIYNDHHNSHYHEEEWKSNCKHDDAEDTIEQAHSDSSSNYNYGTCNIDQNKEHDPPNENENAKANTIDDERNPKQISVATCTGHNSYLYNGINTTPYTFSFHKKYSACNSDKEKYNQSTIDDNNNNSKYNITYCNEDDNISTASSSISISITDYTSTLKEYIQPALERSSNLIKTSLKWNNHNSSIRDNGSCNPNSNDSCDDDDIDDDESQSSTTTPKRKNYTQSGKRSLMIHRLTSQSSNSNYNTTSTYNNHNHSQSKQKQHPHYKRLKIISMPYFFIALIVIFLFISSSWWWQLHMMNHNHLKQQQQQQQHDESSTITSSTAPPNNTTPNPYYFWNLMYNDKDHCSDSGTHDNGNDRIIESGSHLDSVISSNSLFSWWFGGGSISSYNSNGNGSSSSSYSSHSISDVSSSSSSSSSINNMGANDENIPSTYSPPTITSIKSIRNPSQGSKLVIAGKMTVLDGYCNIAELSLNSGEWSLKERIQLSLYNSYSGGEVYQLLVNHTFTKEAFSFFSGDVVSPSGGSLGNDDKSTSLAHGGEMIVVGAFDTTDRNSQTTYCSVGAWDGTELSKVGEGLCNSALSKGMKITTAALAGPNDVYVAGSFNTQVWNGLRHEFVHIYNIAHYNAVDEVWLPLPVGQISCSWCQVTVLALAYDSKRRQLHVAGKFNAIDGHNIPSGLAIYDLDSGHLVAHPGGGLTMYNETQDGVGTALQLDEDAGVLYVMGSFERLGTGQLCPGLAAYEISSTRWTCLADAAHSVMPSGGGNMLLTPYGLMVAGRTTTYTTWPNSSRPYTIALLNATRAVNSADNKSKSTSLPAHEFTWSWLPGFDGHDEPLHSLANGFGDYDGTVFIAGDNLVAAWYYEERTEVHKNANGVSETRTTLYPVTENLSSGGNIQGAIMAIAQLKPDPDNLDSGSDRKIGSTIAVYFIALGALLGMLLALVCNRSINQTLMALFSSKENQMNGISLDMLTYSAIKNTNMNDAYQRAMKVRCVPNPHFLQLIDPQDIILHRIIGEGTFGRVWSARFNSASVAVKEFVFAQAAVAGKSAHQDEIIEEIIGEAGMMAILRHPNVLQLFGCSLTAQAIWIVCELCSLGSLRQLLDDDERELPMEFRLKIALQVAEGMMYLHNQDPPIIHRDLKSHNIMVHETFTETTNKSEEERRLEQRMSENAKNAILPYRFDHSERMLKMSSEATVVAKIGDWGSARATLSGSRTMTHGVGTACWLAPEVILHARSSKYSDVYSYGIILWELATREEVYAGLESTQIIASVANDNLRPTVPENNPLGPLMKKCWCENPQDRLSFKDIVKELNQLINDLENEEDSDDKEEDDDDKEQQEVVENQQDMSNNITQEKKASPHKNSSLENRRYASF